MFFLENFSLSLSLSLSLFVLCVDMNGKSNLSERERERVKRDAKKIHFIVVLRERERFFPRQEKNQIRDNS